MGFLEKLMSDKLLNESITQQVRSAFDSQLLEPVKVLYFGKEDDCDYCPDALKLIQEVVELSDKLEIAQYDIDKDAEIANQYGVTRVPGLVIAGVQDQQVVDYGVRFSGIASGYEFSSLIQGLMLVSRRDSALDPETRTRLQNLDKPVELLVFTTPT